MEQSIRTPFGALLRQWREARRYSQLDLALEANISSKHVSFLETGRNQPSRDMILRLSNAMEVPLRDRNLLFRAAGFAEAYAESSLEAPAMSQVDEALTRILEKHEPYPAMVIDASWRIVRQNQGAVKLLGMFVPEPPSDNAFEVLFSERGLQPYVDAWERLSSILLMRLFREALAAVDAPEKMALFQRIEAMPTTPHNWRELASRLPDGPTIDLVLHRNDERLQFFTTVTTVGTPQDVTLQELKIESYFPSDAATRELCESWR